MSTVCHHRRCSSSKQSERVKQKFPDKLWSVVCDESDDSCIWTSSGESILINKTKFMQRFLSNSSHLFRTSNFKSFVRQLNLYGFRKVNKMRRTDYEIWWEYRNDNFVRDRPDLLKLIKRKASVDELDDVVQKQVSQIKQCRPVKKRRETRPVTKVFNLRLTQLDDDDEADEDSDPNEDQENVNKLNTDNPQNSNAVLEIFSKSQDVGSKKDYLLSFSGDDSIYEIFSDPEIEEPTEQVRTVIARIDSLEQTEQVIDYSMRNLTNQSANEKGKEKVNSFSENLLSELDSGYQEKGKSISDEAFVVNIPLSQKQIWDGNDSYITVSLFPELPSSQEYNPMLCGVNDSSDHLQVKESHFSFSPTL